MGFGGVFFWWLQLGFGGFGVLVGSCGSFAGLLGVVGGLFGGAAGQNLPAVLGFGGWVVDSVGVLGGFGGFQCGLGA